MFKIWHEKKMSEMVKKLGEYPKLKMYVNEYGLMAF